MTGDLEDRLAELAADRVTRIRRRRAEIAAFRAGYQPRRDAGKEKLAAARPTPRVPTPREFGSRTMTKTKIGAADPNRGPTCRICGRPVHSYQSAALGWIGPRCARALPPAERRRLVTAAFRAARSVPVQPRLDAIGTDGDQLDLDADAA